MKNFDSSNFEREFEIFKEKIDEDFRNYFKNNPYKLVKHKIYALTNFKIIKGLYNLKNQLNASSHFCFQDLINFVKIVNFKDFIEFSNTFLNEIRFEWFNFFSNFI